MISAIVYASNSGYTAEYARMLGELTGLPVYDLHRVSDPQPQREVIFLGWLMAGNVKGYAKADRLYKVRAVCQVGMGPATKAASDKLRQKLKLSPEVQVFTLQGGFDIRRLHGPYKWIMQVKCRDIRRTLAGKASLTPAQQLTYDMATRGASAVKQENLTSIVDWYKTTR